MMEKKKYIYFFDNGMWLGYWEEFPDYMTQGETLEELQTNLKDLYQDLTDGSIPCVRHVGEMEVA
jgi:predicted RNase H-like HicB family nuclease